VVEHVFLETGKRKDIAYRCLSFGKMIRCDGGEEEQEGERVGFIPSTPRNRPYSIDAYYLGFVAARSSISHRTPINVF
jgi:hypothetical protein